MHRFLFASDATVMCAYSADDIYLPLTLFAEAELIHPIQFQSMESRLFQALKAFKGAEGCEANLFEEFKKIADAAFFSGYFLINGGCKDAYRLKLTCIEFYYHEDDGNIKDEKNTLSLYCSVIIAFQLV